MPLLFYVEVVVQFNKAHYSVNEGGPPVEICIDLVDGAITFPGLTITVESVAGGTAEGKTFGDRIAIRYHGHTHRTHPQILHKNCPGSQWMLKLGYAEVAVCIYVPLAHSMLCNFSYWCMAKVTTT